MKANPEAADVSAEVLMGQVVEELLDRLHLGERPDVESYVRRYPQLASVLRQMLPALELMRAAGVGLIADDELSASAALVAGCLGDFRILREVGRGGMGVVYEAEQISLHRRVALKVLPFAATMDPRHLRRFQNEAQVAACLHHTNIVPVYFVGCERGVHFYAMQFIDGQPLSDVIHQLRQAERTGPLAGGEPTTSYPPSPGDPAAAPPTLRTVGDATPRTSESKRGRDFFRTAAQLGIQAAQALEHAHELGVIHRDIKPANLLVDGRGTLWVTDFGLAHCQSQAGLTMSGDLVGTLRYMSPEQALAQRVAVDHRTDIYSLGVTLYELLTLEPAFGGQDRQELLRQIAFEEPRPPRRRNKAIPAELDIIILKAMEKNPTERYATAQEMADDLERFLKDEPIRARRPTLLLRTRKWARRHQAAVWAIAASLSVTLLVLAVAIGWGVRDRQVREQALDEVVRQTLEGTGPLLEQGKWPEALALVERAEKLLATAGRADRPPRLVTLQKDLAMAERLEEIYSEPEREKASVLAASGEEAGRTHQAPSGSAEEEFFWGRRQDARFPQAFQEFGIDLETLPPAEAAGRIGATSIAPALVQALDEWAAMRKLAWKVEDPLWKKLVEVARQADPDDWRNRFREALLGGDRLALEKLAEAVPLREAPAATAFLLGYALKDLGPWTRPWPCCGRRTGSARTIFGSTIRWVVSAAMSASRRATRMPCVITRRPWCCGRGIGACV
jgi:serine/threonine protein kinase